MPHPLDSFFAPDSIALIGASRDLEKIPGRLLSMLRKNEYPGKIYPINPNYGDIDGLQCFASIADVGQPIDLAIVIIPARAVLAALEQCAAVGVKNAVIISSGFAEEGGDSAAMQDAIVALAKRTGMRISGPNAEGFLSEVQKVAATFSPTVDIKPDQPRLLVTKKRIGIVAHHLKPGMFRQSPTPVSDGAFRRLAQKVDLELLARVAKSDCLGRGPGFDCSAMDWFLERARELGVQHAPPEPIVKGRHILALGVAPGPRVGEILKQIYERQLDGTITTLDEGLALARELLP